MCTYLGITLVWLVATTTTSFKLPTGQVLSGQLLSLTEMAMVVLLNNQLLSLKTIINDSPAICLLDSGATHSFLSADWCQANGLKFDSTKHFSVYLADEQEISAVGKVKCFVDLGPIKTALTFHMIQCNILCILGILFL